ncbi:MAG: Mov34/MPN/PAD-1 family protein [Candidatus Binataceae bacterium]
MWIELPTEIEKRLRAALREAGKREIGGMLFAEQLVPGSFRIVDFSLDQCSGSHATFRRDPASHQLALQEFFQRTGRDFQHFNYLGEWHSHPSFSVHPSIEDIGTMTEIVEDQCSAITFAVLLIARLRFRIWNAYSLTVFARAQLPKQGRISRRAVWVT